MNKQLPRAAPLSVHRSGHDSVGLVMRPTTTIEPGAHLAAATYVIRHSHDPALVVMRCDRSVPLGTLGYADIAAALSAGRNPENCLVSEVAVASSATVSIDSAIEAAVRLMQAHSIQRLPVMSAKQLVGIVELADCRPEARQRSSP